MQLVNLTLRLGGSQLHTVPVTNATPAEILVLRRIHGDDAVVDVRPVKMDKTKRHQAEFERLATKYDQAASDNAPGAERKSIMAELFPGAIKKLPVTLKEIGMGHLLSPASIASADKGAGSAPAADDVDDVELEPEEDEDDLLDPVDDAALVAA